MGMRMNMVEKNLERQGNEKEVPSFLKTIVSFPLYCFAIDMFTELCCFFSDLIQNTGIGHSYLTHDSLPAKAKMEVMDVFSFYE